MNITAAGNLHAARRRHSGRGRVAGSFGAGSVSTAAGSTALLEFADAIDGPPTVTPPNRRTLDTTFDVTTAGTYEVTLADHAFPVALTTADARHPARWRLDAGRAASPPRDSASFAATPGRYRLLVIAEAPATPGAGAFGVRVRNTATQELLYARSEAVGQVSEVDAHRSTHRGRSSTHPHRLRDFPRRCRPAPRC